MRDKKRIKLIRPDIERRARQILEYERPCKDWEVTFCFLRRNRSVKEDSREEDVDVEFYREDPDGTVTYDLETLTLALQQGLEVRPRLDK